MNRIVTRLLTATAALLVCTALAQAQDATLKQGMRASTAEVQSLARTLPVTIGKSRVWPMPNAPALDADGIVQLNATLVIRANDRRVGLSSNDLVVMYADTGAVSAAASGLAQQVSAFPKLGVTVLKVSTFAQLQPLYQTLSAKFPGAQFDLPVSYAKQRAQ